MIVTKYYQTTLHSAVSLNPPNSRLLLVTLSPLLLITNCHNNSPLFSTNSINAIASIPLHDHSAATSYADSNCGVHRLVIGFLTTSHLNIGTEVSSAHQTHSSIRCSMANSW